MTRAPQGNRRPGRSITGRCGIGTATGQAPAAYTVARRFGESERADAPGADAHLDLAVPVLGGER